MTDPNSGSTAENRPYLGDPQIIGKLLKNIARETIQCRVASAQNILSPEDAKSIEEKEATNAARALLGRDRKYAVDANWNVPGAIDSFLKTELALQEKGSEPILVEGLLTFTREIHDRLGLLNNPKQDPAAEGRVQDIIEKYTNLLLGLHAGESAPASTTPAGMTSISMPAPVAAVPPAPLVNFVPPAPEHRAPEIAPSAAPVVTEFPEPKAERSRSGGWKWAALLLLLLMVGTTGIYLMKKPAPAPEPVQVVDKPVAPKTVAAAPVLNSSGTIDLIDESGKTIKTIAMNDGQKIGHLYDSIRKNGKSLLLVATDSPGKFDLWLMDESGEGRQVNPNVIDAKLSSDASMIAYTTAGNILIVEEVGGKQIATASSAHDLVWAADNKAVIFVRLGDGTPKSRPHVMELCKLVLEGQAIEIVETGLYDNFMPIMQPAGKFILLTAGRETGLPSFWKITTDGGQPVQVTNIRLDESDAAWVPTPFSTAQWSADGRWLLYDFKDGSIEQIWGMEFDDAGNLKRSTRITDGLVPRWIGGDKFVCLKGVNGVLQASVQSVPSL